MEAKSKKVKKLMKINAETKAGGTVGLNTKPPALLPACCVAWNGRLIPWASVWWSGKWGE